MIANDFITLSEPACGAGSMILAFANILIKAGHNPAQKVWVEAIDIDRLSALMCYLQLSLWNIPARVIVGNAFSMEVRESFFTPAHYLNFWDFKLKKRRDKKAECEKSSNNDDTSNDDDIKDEVIVSSRFDKVLPSGQLSLF